jgi:integrase
MENKRQHYLSMHKYKIFQDKDGRWKTTLPDKTKKNGRRLIAKKSLDDLNIIVADFYEVEEKKEQNPILRLSKNVTLEELYPVWLESRRLEAKNIRTVKRNHQEWNRYYLGTPITKVPMNLLTVNELKDWAHKMIDENQFNKREYYDMTLIIKKCFEYASDEGLCDDTWAIAKTKVNTKKLKKIAKPEAETQIYFTDEKIKLVNHALKMFVLRPWNIGVLTIPFLFLTGMRISEVVALKYDDLKDNEIHVRNGEVSDYYFDEETQSFKYVGKIVEDHVKTDAGTRIIPYMDGAKKIIDFIEKSSQYYNYYDNGYIFCPASKRMVSNSIDHLITRYCEELGIPKKSAHKIRKTYISQAINSGIDLDTVRRVSGHVDLQTTFQSYLFSLERKDEIYERFNSVFQDVM